MSTDTDYDIPVWEPARYGKSWTLTLRRPFLAVIVAREVQSRDNPSPTPYSATVFGIKLIARWATSDEAKAAAVASARRLLNVASYNLGLYEGNKES